MLGLILFMGAVILFPLVAGEVSFIFTQNERADIVVSCFDINNSFCSSATPCHITVFYPNNSVMIRNGTMTYNGTYYNYSLASNDTLVMGEYSAVTSCVGSHSGFSTFNFKITTTGFTGTIGFYFLILGIGFVILILGFYLKDPWIVLLGTVAFYFIGLYIFKYGIDIIKNNTVTMAIAIVITAIAMYVSIKTVLEVIQENY